MLAADVLQSILTFVVVVIGLVTSVRSVLFLLRAAKFCGFFLRQLLMSVIIKRLEVNNNKSEHLMQAHDDPSDDRDLVAGPPALVDPSRDQAR